MLTAIGTIHLCYVLKHGNKNKEDTVHIIEPW